MHRRHHHRRTPITTRTKPRTYDATYKRACTVPSFLFFSDTYTGGRRSESSGWPPAHDQIWRRRAGSELSSCNSQSMMLWARPATPPPPSRAASLTCSNSVGPTTNPVRTATRRSPAYVNFRLRNCPICRLIDARRISADEVAGSRCKGNASLLSLSDFVRRINWIPGGSPQQLRLAAKLFVIFWNRLTNVITWIRAALNTGEAV